MSNLTQDLRFSLRRLLAAPMFAAFSILTLGIGIGSTTAIYSLIHALQAPIAGVADIDSLVNITHTEAGSVPMIGLSYGDFEDLRSRQTVFQGIAAWTIMRPSYVANGVAETAFGEAVSGDYFQVLGVVAERGRTIQPSDVIAGAPPVVVISHGVWQRVFGGAPDVVGRGIKINGTAFEVIGVAPQTFRGVFNSGVTPSAMWAPMTVQALTSMTAERLADRDSRWLLVKARLKPGVDLERARAEVAGIASQLDKGFPIGRDSSVRHPMPFEVSRSWVVKRTVDVTMNESTSNMFTPVAATFMVTVGLVLLVACTNLANLAVARGAIRRGEMAVRLALGASRWQLVRELTMEYLVVAIAGGLLGVGLARSLFVLVADDIAVGNGATVHFGLRLDPVVLAVSACSALLALVVAGVIPALQNTRGDLRGSMASGTQQSLPRWRGRRFLIAGQVTVSVLLVSLAALCVTQIRAASRIETGMDLEHLAVGEIDFGTQRYVPERAKQIVNAALTQLSHQPGVVAAAASSGLPGGTVTRYAGIGIGGKLSQSSCLMASTPGIFKTLGVTITSGRAFDERDTASSDAVAVISEGAAKILFGRTDVVGESFVMRPQPMAGRDLPQQKTLRIVGLATDTSTGPAGARSAGIVYAPIEQQYEDRLTLLARTEGDPKSMILALRQTLSNVDREAAIGQTGTGLDIAGPANSGLLIIGSIAGVLGSFALILALAGLYGVLSHVIARRTREIGVRLALGADRRAILRMVVREGIRPVVYGLVAGLVVGGILRTAVRPIFALMLPAFDLSVVVLVPALMLAAALVAIYLPARRAARVEPNVTLRDV